MKTRITSGRTHKDSLPPMGSVVMVKTGPSDTEAPMLAAELHKFVALYGNSPEGTWRIPSEIELRQYYAEKRAHDAVKP